MDELNAKMTAIADEIRELSGSENALGLDAMVTKVQEANEEVALQAELLEQALTDLKAKVDPELYSHGHADGYAEGYEVGNTEGYTKGHTDGVEQGYADASMEAQSFEDDLIDKSFTLESYTNDRVKTVGEGVFWGASALQQVSFPNVEVIKNYAFRNCKKLTEATFGNVTYVGQEAFMYTSILEANFPYLEYVEANSFRENYSLAYADFGVITTISTYAFFYCSKLATLIIRTPSVCSLPYLTSLRSTPIAGGTGFVYVPDDLVEEYKAATNWSTYADQIKPISELEV